MNLVSRLGSNVVIRQVPVVLLIVTAIFSLPFLAFSLAMILGGKEADGKFFCLFFGFFVLWVFLEFVATRERFEIEPTTRVLRRTVIGVFRRRQQTIDLGDITDISLEQMMQSTGTNNVRRQYLYLNGRQGKILINSPSKVSLNHREMGKILHDATLLPFRELRDGKEVNV